MAPDPLSQPQGSAFSASQITPLLHAIVDPEGKGEISPEDAASIEQVEANLARLLSLAR
jgi:hypothetical protein